ncbi:MAG: galactosyltransferase-related protein [Psychroserpens sp.]|uniref:glycosyltransferase family 2 protein n=1 Tax=Psychroserpens sp. TaxID=2020870 RepID=UPI003C733DB3
MRNQVSLIVIFHGRHNHLINVLKGLENGLSKPDEIILVEINSKKLSLPKFNLKIKHFLIWDFDKSDLPIAAARNAGASLAKFEVLAFLDVDCIPSYSYIDRIANFEISSSCIYMATPMYLENPVNSFEDFNFTRDAILHPARPVYHGNFKTEDYGLFWSLCFYITTNLFFEIGGFDETFRGYGAEDTDLSFKCRERGYELILTSEIVYHQQHKFMRPPVNSIDSIIRNSNYFYTKWNVWPMANHLEAFSKLGYIDWNTKQKSLIEIIKPIHLDKLEELLVYNERFA